MQLRLPQNAFRPVPAPFRRCRQPSMCRAQRQSADVTERESTSNGSIAQEQASRSLYNTGTTNVSTSKLGPISLVDHELEHEKTVVFVRHGMTTWNEQKRIQASSCCLWLPTT